MSQENVEIVGRIAEAFEQGGLDEFRTYYHPDIEWHEDPSFSEAGVYRGLDAVEAYNRQLLSEFAELDYEPQELIDANDHVVANLHTTDAERRAGPRTTSRHGGCSPSDGRPIRVHAFLDRTRALEAVGLRE